MDANKIIKWGRILAIVCLMAYSVLVGAFGYSFNDIACKILLGAGGVLLIAVSLYGLYIKNKEQ